MPQAPTKATSTVPIPETLQSIPGLPNKLKIYLMTRSSFWQVSYYESTTNKTIKRSIPKFPTIPKRDEPCGWFTREEYKTLLVRAKGLVGHEYAFRAEPKGSQKQVNVIRRLKFTSELPQLIEFMASSVIRPTDIKNMQHKHVEIIRQDNTFA